MPYEANKIDETSEKVGLAFSFLKSMSIMLSTYKEKVTVIMRIYLMWREMTYDLTY
jgi:hypothetical protein